jgi:hypothetical protein
VQPFSHFDPGLQTKGKSVSHTSRTVESTDSALCVPDIVITGIRITAFCLDPSTIAGPPSQQLRATKFRCFKQNTGQTPLRTRSQGLEPPAPPQRFRNASPGLSSPFVGQKFRHCPDWHACFCCDCHILHVDFDGESGVVRVPKCRHSFETEQPRQKCYVSPQEC